METAWKRGGEVFAEISLASEQASEAERFGIHPALLDAALHPVFLGADPSRGVSLPFSWSGVALYGAAGASALRVRIVVEDARLSLDATDQDGGPAGRVEAIAARPVAPGLLQGRSSESAPLFNLGWAELELPDPSAPSKVEVFECVGPAGRVPGPGSPAPHAPGPLTGGG